MTVDINSADFQLPATAGSSMYEPITLNTVEDITTGPSGTGAFDKLMVSMKAHLQTEYDAGRITGAEYTKAYISLTQSALQTALQFVLQNDNSFWEAQNAQVAAITGRIQMETSRETYASALFNVTTMLPKQSTLLDKQISGEDLKNQELTYNLATTLPLQTTMLGYQNAGAALANQISTYNLDTMLPLQSALLTLQNTGEDTKNQTAAYNLSSILPLQVILMGLQNTGEGLKNDGQTTQNAILSYQVGTMLPMQLKLTQEQMEAQRAQTSNTRSDGVDAIQGLIAGQKALYAQQVISYQRDAEVKAAKLFTDAWITQKTIDDAILPPPNFTNTSLDAILGTLKTNNAIG